MTSGSDSVLLSVANLYGLSLVLGFSPNGRFSVDLLVICVGRYRWLATNAAAVEQLTHLTADLLNRSKNVKLYDSELKGIEWLLRQVIGCNSASAICHDASCV